MYLKEKKMQDGGKYIFGTLKQSSYFTYTTSTLKQNGIIEKFYHAMHLVKLENSFIAMHPFQHNYKYTFPIKILSG